MQPARFKQAKFLLVEINNAKSTSPAVSSGRSAGSFPEQRLVIEPIPSVEQLLLLQQQISYQTALTQLPFHVCTCAKRQS